VTHSLKIAELALSFSQAYSQLITEYRRKKVRTDKCLGRFV